MNNILDWASKIKPLNIKDLDGRTLKMFTAEDEEEGVRVTILGGQDIASKHVYILMTERKAVNENNINPQLSGVRQTVQ